MCASVAGLLVAVASFRADTPVANSRQVFERWVQEEDTAVVKDELIEANVREKGGKVEPWFLYCSKLAGLPPYFS